MTTIDLHQYSYLWDGSDTDWVLFKVPSGRLKVVNQRTGALLLIEDAAVADAVAKRLKEAGRGEITALPGLEPED